MKAVLCSLAFGNLKVLERSFAMIDATQLGNFPWLMLNQHYPLPSSQAFQEGLLHLCDKHRFQLFDAGENIGLHEGFNYLMRSLDDDDILIGVDPDVLPASLGWDVAMMKAFEDPRNVWVSLANECSFKEMHERGFDREMFGDLKIRVPKTPVINSICAWRVSWLRQCGGLSEPSKYYGGLECSMWRFLDQKSKRWVFLEHYWEHLSNDFVDYSDKIYKEYKWEHAHKGYPKSFDAFIAERR